MSAKVSNMNCSVSGIAKAVVSENQNQTELNVRKISKLSEVDLAKVTSSTAAIAVAAIRATKPSLDGKAIYVLDLTKTDDGEFILKYKISGNDEVLEDTLENFSPFTTEKANFHLDKNHVSKLYSDAESANNYDNYEELALDITSNPEKIMEVANFLIEADYYHNDPTHNSTLLSQLGNITSSLKEIMPKLNVHINKAGNKNEGHINIDTKNVYITKGIGGSKSLLEVYVHELYHAVTHFAITSKDTHVRTYTARIEQVRDYFLKNTKESDLVKMSGGKLSEQDAAAILNHLTNPKVGLQEFVALAMTNKAVMNQLKTLDTNTKKEAPKSLFYRLLDAVNNLFNGVSQLLSGEPKGDDLQRMIWLTAQLQESHKKPWKAKRFSSINNLISVVEPVEKIWRDFLDKQMEKDLSNISRNVQKSGEGNLKYFARLAARSYYDEQARDIIGNTLSLWASPVTNVFSPEGSIRSVLRDFLESDQTQDMVERLGMISQYIDQQREHRAHNIAKMVRDTFDTPLTEDEEKAFTAAILDTDLSTIFYNYDVKSLLDSNKNIDKEVAKVADKLLALTDQKSVNFYNAQAILLAKYMIQGKDNIGLLLNAGNIAKKLGTTEENLEVSNEVINLVDELVSLKALALVDGKDKAMLKQRMETDLQGVENIVGLQLGHKDKSENLLFPTPADKFKIVKGYSSEITNDDIDILYAPVRKEIELNQQGYVLQKTLDKHNLDSNTSSMGLYVKPKFVQQQFHRVGMRMTERKGRGTTITESHLYGRDFNTSIKAAADISKMKKRQAEVYEAMLDGIYDQIQNKSDNLVTPLLSNIGHAVDFRYSMDKNAKIQYLEMERKISTVMGRSYASTFDKVATEKYNEEMLKLIAADADKNLTKDQISAIGKNQKEYIKISKNSSNTEVKDLWGILPDAIKKKHPEGFMLRRDLMYSYLGYREMSITDLPGFKQLLANPSVAKNILKYSLQLAEKLWQEFIKISKADVIIRTPGVLIGNIVSNFVLAYMSGHSVADIFRLKYQSVKELKLYIDGFNESIKLNAKKDAKTITKEELRRLNVIKNNLNNSPVKDLIDEGFYTTIIEEMDQTERGGSYFNNLAKKKLNKVPKIFHDGANMLYITESTKLFKLIEKGVQMSDFAARYAQYHLMVEKGIPKEKAVKTVRDNYIDYNKPTSKFVEWSNRMGFVMFTKYFTRIQRVLRDYGKNHPLKVALTVLGQDYLLGDIDDITDQSILTKDMGNLFYNPFDNMMRVITPSSFEAMQWTLNKI